ncbi:MAG: sufurtransferase FdhD [Gammaproteobacteria bacterium]|nr:MAG: sufurtransferase FdhD [Gammaproteobacteria bacterium]
MNAPARPRLSQSGRPPVLTAEAMNERGETVVRGIATERPLTIYLDRREVVTLMTIGQYPEHLVLGYLRNQRLLESLEQVESVQVDWETGAAAVTTRQPAATEDERLSRRTVTSGCGQGTLFGNILEEVASTRLQPPRLRQSDIYRLLRSVARYNEIYRHAGAVHSCALCHGEEIIYSVEDVGRHNAVDTISGMMWMDGVEGADKLFYTTGRLTSEMVIKVVQMKVPVLLSRSGITHAGLEYARRCNVLTIARAKGRHFLVYHGAGNVVLDEPAGESGPD